MPAPTVAIVGRSGSGKTTIIEGLIGELARRGYRVATVKHTHHGFEIDKVGKDSWRHRKAGASPVVITSKGHLAIIMDVDREPSLIELRDRFLSGVDIVLAEGFRGEEVPKVEVLSRGEVPSASHLIALVGEESLSAPIPAFKPQQVKELADLIEQRFLKG